MIDTGLLVLLLPAVVGGVEFLKTMGLTGRGLTAASMILGSALAMAAILLDVGAARAVLTCLLVGMGACGLYDLTKLIGVSRPRIVSSEPIFSEKEIESLRNDYREMVSGKAQ